MCWEKLGKAGKSVKGYYQGEAPMDQMTKDEMIRRKRKATPEIAAILGEDDETSDRVRDADGPPSDRAGKGDSPGP